jgi:hypothetical protein
VRRGHEHDCTTCKLPFPCPGTLERNWDGFPEVICTFYHEAGNTECEDCVAAEACDWCGAKHQPMSTVHENAGELGALTHRYCTACVDEATETA